MSRGDLSEALAGAVDPTALMQRICDRTLDLITAAEGAAVSILDDQLVTYVCGAGTSAAVGGTVVHLSDSLSGLAIRTGQVLHSTDARHDSRVDAEACARLGVVSLVCIPLTKDHVPFGVLAVNSPRPDAFSHHDVTLLSRLADFVSVTIGSAVDLHRVSGALVHLGATSTATDRYLMGVLDPQKVALLDAREHIEQYLEDPRRIGMAFQPIIDLATGEVISVEALARFYGSPERPPNQWFEDAHRVGLGVALERVAMSRALEYEPQLPEPLTIAVNVGPEAILGPHLRTLLARLPPGRLVIELTEHTAFARFPELPDALNRLRRMGALVSVDDTGSGYSTLTHILTLAPDYIKLDRELIAGIDIDPVRRALVTSLVAFAGETGAEILAEGIENADELETVRSLGVLYGQGFHLARPAPLDQLHLTDVRADALSPRMPGR